MKEGFPESVKNSVSMCSKKQEAFSVFKQSFALVGLFKKGLGVRVVRFFSRANEKSS